MKPGERIKHFRKNKGLTQKEFANKLGYSDAFLSDIERGKAEPSREFLKKMKLVFGIPSDYILYGSGTQWEEIKKKLSGGKYGTLPTSTRNLLDNVVEILESGNEVIIDTLKTNIKAFLKLTHAIKRDYETKTNIGD